MVFGMIPIGFGRFPIRMGWRWVGIDGKGYANTTYISELHAHIPAGLIFSKTKTNVGRRRKPAAAARQPVFFLFIRPAGMWGWSSEM